jgi:hypothetical protein
MRIRRFGIVIAAALAVLTLTTVSSAAAPTVSGGVLVRTDDGYIITGTLRDADGKVISTAHGTLIETTTGFNTCPFFGVPFPCGPDNVFATCNLLGGGMTFNYQGKKYDGPVTGNINGRADSALCLDSDNPSAYQLFVYVWSQTHTIPGEFPDIFQLGGTVQQTAPRLFKWSGGWSCICFSGPPA